MSFAIVDRFFDFFLDDFSFVAVFFIFFFLSSFSFSFSFSNEGKIISLIPKRSCEEVNKSSNTFSEGDVDEEDDVTLITFALDDDDDDDFLVLEGVEEIDFELLALDVFMVVRFWDDREGMEGMTTGLIRFVDDVDDVDDVEGKIVRKMDEGSNRTVEDEDFVGVVVVGVVDEEEEGINGIDVVVVVVVDVDVVDDDDDDDDDDCECGGGGVEIVGMVGIGNA